MHPDALVGTPFSIVAIVSAHYTTSSLTFNVSTQGVSLNVTWTAKAPATVSIVQVTTNPASGGFVSQANATITFAIFNPSFYPATIDGMAFRFMAGSIDVLSNYTLAANQSVPFVVSSKARTYVQYTVFVHPNALVNTPFSIVEIISAHYTTGSFTFNLSAPVVSLNVTWTAKAPPAVSISQVSANPASFVMIGQPNATITFAVNNPGIFPATIDDITIRFMAGPNNVVSGYTLAANRSFASFVVSGMARAYIQYTVSVHPDALVGTPFSIVAIVSAHYTTSSLTFNVSTQGVNLNVTWTAKAPATASIVQVTTNPASGGLVGQANATITFAIFNPSFYPATIDGMAFRLMAGSIDVVSNYTLAANQSVPFVVSAKARTYVQSTVFVHPNALVNTPFSIVEIISAHYTTGSFTFNLSTPVVSLNVTWTAKAPPSVSISQVSANPVSNGMLDQANATITFAINNPGIFPVLDQLLQLHKSLERNRKGKLDSRPVEQSHHLVAEERTVHPDLDDHVGKPLTNSLNALQHKSFGSIGIMDIARPMINIKHLTRLGNRAEQRIITTRSFFLPVESDRRAFPSTPLGRKHHPIKVQGQSRKSRPDQPLQHPATTQLTNPFHTVLIYPRQGTRYGRNIRQPGYPQQALHHRVVPVIVHVPQLAVA